MQQLDSVEGVIVLADEDSFASPESEECGGALSGIPVHQDHRVPAVYRRV
jgi:hypothetical protein